MMIGKNEGSRFKKKNAAPFSLNSYVSGVLSGNRAMLAKCITLIESNHEEHLKFAQQILQQILPYTGQSVRIGITGVPGAGKSTFIDNFGQLLCNLGKKVAVLAIDPSSSVTKGSILGDKTRMEHLSREPNAFIRPSPAGGQLGGVHQKTRESILLCEAAGFDVILVETVGVGQSEVAIRSMVDMVILLTITGGGDDLQTMKKGTVEIADCVVITKADGDNKTKAMKTKQEFNKMLRILNSATDHWRPRALTCSSYTGEGLTDIWKEAERFISETKETGVFIRRRREQTKNWLMDMIMERLKASFMNSPSVQEKWAEAEESAINQKEPVAALADSLLSIYFQEMSDNK